MKEALNNLKLSVSNFKKIPEISDTHWQEFTQNTVVALMAGGEGSRFKAVTGNENINKNSFKLPNDDTMFEMTLRMYAEAGIKNFVALVYHHADTIEELLGDGSSLGVNIKYSYDPEQPVGKGGAILNALQNGSIPRDKTVIVHNPDDVIINFEGSFPKHIAAGHIHGVDTGHLATVITVEETPYSFTGMKVVDNEVTQIEMYPQIPIPTHIGVTIFDPKAYILFEKYFNLKEKSDFEKVLFPILSENKQLYAASIPSHTWLAVNNPKAFKQLISHLESLEKSSN